jgi:hypothetical protein
LLDEIETLPLLHTLILRNISVTDEDLESIARSPSISALHIEGQFTCRGLQELGKMRTLRYLTLRGVIGTEAPYCLDDLTLIELTLDVSELAPGLLPKLVSSVGATIVGVSNARCAQDDLVAVALLPHVSALQLVKTRVEDSTLALIKLRRPDVYIDVREGAP